MEEKNCPLCWQPMFEVYYGDDIIKYRCMECNIIVGGEGIEEEHTR